ITTQKQAEETLRQANAELAHAARAKDEFLANMSHELRTPLNAILGLSEALLEQVRGPLSPRQQESLRNIEASGQHLLALINDILDLSKVEAGRLELQIEPVMVAEVCHASMLFIKEQSSRKLLQLAFRLNNQLAEITADPRRLKQMLVNLLSNAVKFTPAGGQVDLEVDADEAAGTIRFMVRDSGIGIAPHDLAWLFQPFKQLDSSLSRQHEGTGLGLALVRRLAELHGGSVAVESALGKGSCFTISLPYEQPLAAATEPDPLYLHANMERQTPKKPAEAFADASSSVRILLVEDNEVNIVAISDYLQARGYELVIARNGQEALRRAGEQSIDLILMDIQMPEMDGLEATRRLRDIPAYAAVPIIALTALAMPGDRERCLAAGANEYLTKPVSLRGLADLIERMRPRRPDIYGQ
ncbi:MAG: response regulator, partial [Oscillochloris sp.]|nr:response regulator [Oscillochloris sp.]